MELCYTLVMKAAISLVLRIITLPLSFFLSLVPLTSHSNQFIYPPYSGIKGLPIPYSYSSSQPFPIFPTSGAGYIFAIDFFICFLLLNTILDIWYEKKFVLRNFILIVALSAITSLFLFILCSALAINIF